MTSPSSYPKFSITAAEDDKDVAFIELLAVSGKSLLRHCKVLSGGDKLSVLFGYPRELASERANKKFLKSIGVTYSESLTRVAARSTQVGHDVNTNYDHQDKLLEGDPQLISLPFKCIVGGVPGPDMAWFKWYKGEKVKVGDKEHKQFYDVMLIKVVSQASYAEEYQSAEEHIMSDSDASSDGDDDGNGTNNNNMQEDDY